VLQNAFDAVKEQIALKRLEGDPSDTKRTDAIIALQSVELRFEEREGRFWLLCTDSGVGMTRSIIEKYLLVSGSSRRHDILELERRCEAAGFHLGRTGQFGIGVLSYFMLADRIEIRTRRSPERGDAETHGWEFQTEGVGSFGELRKNPQMRHGTTVGLRLRQDVVANQDEFLSRLQEYLLDTLLRIPCSLQLLVEGETDTRLRLEGGWQSLTSRLVDNFLRSVEDPSRAPVRFPGDRVPKSHLERRDLVLREWSGVAERFRAAIRWKEESGQLPGGIGHYRLSVPFFHLPRGRSSLFFDFEPDHDLARPLPLVSTFSLALRPELRTSFQGMRVRSALSEGELIQQTKLPYLGEIDWEDPQSGQITVDRRTFSLKAEASEAVSWLKSRGEEFQAMVLSEERSDYAELNTFLNPLVPQPSEARWFVNSLDQNGLLWTTFSFPVLSGSSYHVLNNAVQAQGNGGLVSITQAFEVHIGHRERIELEWCSGNRSRICPDRPAVVSTSPLVIIPQYVPLSRNLRDDFLKGEFPPVWSGLAALGSQLSSGKGEPWLWNRDHPFVQLVEPQDLEWFRGFELWQLSDNLLQSRGRSALFLLKVLETQDPHKYLELAKDFRADFWRDLWECVAVVPLGITAWVQHPHIGLLLEFGPEDIKWFTSTDPHISQYLPDPGDEWKLTLIYRDDSANT
jgi:hypothetical protein